MGCLGLGLLTVMSTIWHLKPDPKVESQDTLQKAFHSLRPAEPKRKTKEKDNKNLAHL